MFYCNLLEGMDIPLMHFVSFLRCVRKFGKTDYKLHICPPISLYQLDYHWTGFDEILHWGLALKSVKKIEVWL
jgi:hypothetical protein